MHSPTGPFQEFQHEHPILLTPVIWHPTASRDGYTILLFRKKFLLDEPLSASLYLSACQRFILYLDGELIGRGPSRGDPNKWNVSNYILNIRNDLDNKYHPLFF